MTASRRRSWLARVGLGAVVVLLTAACASNAPLDTLEPRGPDARSIDNLIGPVFIVAGIVLVLVGGATIYMMIRFRARRGVDEMPEQVHGNTKLEIGWTVVPALILAVIAVFTVAEVQRLNRFDPEESLHVVVVGNQWWWEYRYYFDGFDPDTDHDPDINPALEAITDSEGKREVRADLVTSTQLVVPTGQEILLHITARDVIHSHWIPALSGKRDAVPGRFSPWKITAEDPGVYFGQCTEFCGLSHSRMRMQVVALEPEEFVEWVAEVSQPATAPSARAAAWLDQQKRLSAGEEIDDELLLDPPSATAEERGMVLFRNQCSACHLADGINEDIFVGAAQVSGAAPDLTFFANRTLYAGGIFELYQADGQPFTPQLRAWLRDPNAEKEMYPQGDRGMPNLGLSEDQITDLVAFLLTLGSPPSAEVIAGSLVND